MSKIYTSMFVEKCYTIKDRVTGEEKEVWKRFFEKTKVQMEYIHQKVIYWRGMGGGKFLSKKQETSDWVYLEHIGAVKLQYRVARVDWDRLMDKAAKANKIRERET